MACRPARLCQRLATGLSRTPPASARFGSGRCCAGGRGVSTRRGMVAGVALLAGAPLWAAADPLRTAVAAAERASGGRLGVAVQGAGLRFAWRRDERFPLCSTFKLLLAAAILRRSIAARSGSTAAWPCARRTSFRTRPSSRRGSGRTRPSPNWPARRSSSATMPPPTCYSARSAGRRGSPPGCARRATGRRGSTAGRPRSANAGRQGSARLSRSPVASPAPWACAARRRGRAA